ncbi:MAG: DUF494 domain-containing protein [Burkholderiaceae bacterium]
MFNVLVYLYQHYGALRACPDSDSLAKTLADAGFDDDEISEALSWLQSLAKITEGSVAVAPASASSFRIYADSEIECLDLAARGFLAFLEAAEQLTPSQREIVIERALEFDESPIPLEALKIVVLMVLWSQQADIDTLVLEELLDHGGIHRLH